MEDDAKNVEKFDFLAIGTSLSLGLDNSGEVTILGTDGRRVKLYHLTGDEFKFTITTWVESKVVVQICYADSEKTKADEIHFFGPQDKLENLLEKLGCHTASDFCA